MKDGVVFFYTCWLLWIVVTFLLPKDSIRFWMGVILLGLMTSSGFQLTHLGVASTLAPLFILSVSIVLVVRIQSVFKPTIYAIIIGVGYSGMLMWETIVPVWIIMPRLLLMPIILFLLLQILCHGFYEKMSVLGLGTVLGEYIYSFIIKGYGYVEMVGEFAYLDIFSAVLILIVITQRILLFFTYIETEIQKSVKRRAGIRS